MIPDWFKPRGYSHLDSKVGESFANSIDEEIVRRHAWSPLISYTKRTKRYKRVLRITEYKDREIMYASHRDACILSKYSAELTNLLNDYYKLENLEDSVIAYRALGKANYHFSAEAQRFAIDAAPCVIICFDVTGFFDNLDHGILKSRLKRILDVEEIPEDWYKVFRHVTRYREIRRSDLAAHPKFGPKIKLRRHEPIATISEIRAEKIPIALNKTQIGIPQGTPISSTLSNLYLIDLDKAMATACRKMGALYQRYSDDIVIIVRPEFEVAIQGELEKQIRNHRLEINPKKIDRVVFDFSDPKAIQYLGFNLSPEGAVIRSSSLARQWRKAKRSIARTKKIGLLAIGKGKAATIFTKKLRRRFNPVGVRNFSSYARRSAKAFGSKKIVRQALRLERMVDAAIREIKAAARLP